MRKEFKNPEMAISVFMSENVITTSGVEPAAVKNMQTSGNSGITLGGQDNIAETNMIALVL